MGNEQRCLNCEKAVITSRGANVSAYIKGLDPNHMVTLGDEGWFDQVDASTGIRLLLHNLLTTTVSTLLLTCRFRRWTMVSTTCILISGDTPMNGTKVKTLDPRD